MATDTSAISLADMFAAQAREIRKDDWRRARKIKARMRKIKSLIAEYEELGDC